MWLISDPFSRQGGWGGRLPPRSLPPRSLPPGLILAIYATVGGVGKTTTAAALAFEFASQGRRVLLCDCDPQRSLSAWLLQSKLQSNESLHGFYLREHPYDVFLRGTQENKLGDPGDPATLHEQMRALADADLLARPRPVNVVYIAGPEPERGVEPIQAPPWDARGRVFLMPGDQRLHTWDAALVANDARAMPHRCIRCTADAVDADVVILDLNPGRGSLNAALLTSADSILVPVRADLFSVEMLRGLADVLLDMSERCRPAASTRPDAAAVDPLHPRRPCLLGCVLTGGRQEPWVDRVWAALSALFNKLRDSRPMIGFAQSESTLWLPCAFLAFVPCFGALGGLAQQRGVPANALPDAPHSLRDSYAEVCTKLLA
eukprot:gene11641-13055_t